MDLKEIQKSLINRALEKEKLAFEKLEKEGLGEDQQAIDALEDFYMAEVMGFLKKTPFYTKLQFAKENPSSMVEALASFQGSHGPKVKTLEDFLDEVLLIELEKSVEF
jgi:hypothetical protein